MAEKRLEIGIDGINQPVVDLIGERGVGIARYGRSRGTADYEVALQPVDEYGLDWWFRSVDDGAELAWP